MLTQRVTSDRVDEGVNEPAAACVAAGNVWVTVERDTGLRDGGCATQFRTGLEALASAGFTATTSGSLLTAIDGYPGRAPVTTTGPTGTPSRPATRSGTRGPTPTAARPDTRPARAVSRAGATWSGFPARMPGTELVALRVPDTHPGSFPDADPVADADPVGDPGPIGGTQPDGLAGAVSHPGPTAPASGPARPGLPSTGW
ncbi:hypothetical protein G7085_07540 [Tessaracoccus sp. HDW20]|uniref:hypothetical protein n=1 Tax=Tessaracoccus coleopterorum TaxID=2714950 RepID=UPI0018D43F51|nr:hypothetical protein [Tessaracoccus coleopterorum]NHB84505.1 hypothetical protein [Tessaracoccus coleopterorum]